jgi:hydroxysqualene dehydroxylase
MMPRSVHIIGAGLAGLSAAVRLIERGTNVRLYEATAQAGGRCRSYHDLTIGMTIGARHHLIGPGRASVPFADLASGQRWTLHANDGPFPWWIFSSSRRVPGTSARSYLEVLNLLRAAPGATVGDRMACRGTLYDRLIRPFLLAALNINPAEGSAPLAAAVVRETLLAGGRNYHPLIACPRRSSNLA